MSGKAQPLWIFLWRLDDKSISAEDRILAYAREFAEASGAWQILNRLNAQPALARSERGKPFFPAALELHFSLSHSGDYGACAFGLRQIGLDLQIQTRCDRKAIARRFFHPYEYSFLEKDDFAQFFQVWTAKESYMKYTGTGITGGMGKFCVADEVGIKRKMDEVEFYHWTVSDNYSMCLCVECLPGEAYENKNN